MLGDDQAKGAVEGEIRALHVGEATKPVRQAVGVRRARGGPIGIGRISARGHRRPRWHTPWPSRHDADHESVFALSV
jgi:hypothetical protein